MSLPFGWWGCTMATDERARVALYERLDETMGRGAADTLMSYLPPVGWADVATKHDLAQLEQRIEQRFELQELRFDERLGALELRLMNALGDFRIESRTEAAAFRENWHAEQRASQRQVIVLLMVALVSLVAASVGLR